jgi:hypothetical protein
MEMERRGGCSRKISGCRIQDGKSHLADGISIERFIRKKNGLADDASIVRKFLV